MHSITLAASLFFTIALALPKAKLEVIQVREIVKPRQDDSSSLDLGVPTGCIMPDSIMSIELSVPTAPPAVLSALVSFTDACNLPTLTGSVSSQYSSYQEAISSWYSQYGDVIMSWSETYQTACPIYASIMQSVSMGSAVNTAEFLSLATASCGDDSTASDAGVVATSSGEDAKTTGTADRIRRVRGRERDQLLQGPLHSQTVVVQILLLRMQRRSRRCMRLQLVWLLGWLVL
jgi:hypothetical protein